MLTWIKYIHRISTCEVYKCVKLHIFRYLLLKLCHSGAPLVCIIHLHITYLSYCSFFQIELVKLSCLYTLSMLTCLVLTHFAIIHHAYTFLKKYSHTSCLHMSQKYQYNLKLHICEDNWWIKHVYLGVMFKYYFAKCVINQELCSYFLQNV